MMARERQSTYRRRENMTDSDLGARLVTASMSYLSR